jgi:hypothetical protein
LSTFPYGTPQYIDTPENFLLRLTMRKCFIFFILPLLFLYENAYGLDVKGLQPVDPYGVFTTFSAESLPKGKVAFSAGAEISIDPDYYRSIVKTAFGITDTFELMMTVPYDFGSDIADGFEDIAIGIKHRFFDEGKYGPSLAYILNVSVRSGAEHLTTDGRYGIGLILSKKVGPVNGHLNFFYEEPGTKSLDEELSFLAGLDFAAAHNFKFLAELYCRKSHESEKIDLAEARIGYRVKTADLIYTTFGVGFDLKNRDPETRVMFSVTFLSPKEKKKIQKIYEEE